MVPGTVQFLMSLLRGGGPGLAQMEEKLLPSINEYQQNLGYHDSLSLSTGL